MKIVIKSKIHFYKLIKKKSEKLLKQFNKKINKNLSFKQWKLLMKL
jgi:hypothetical protein